MHSEVGSLSDKRRINVAFSRAIDVDDPPVDDTPLNSSARPRFYRIQPTNPKAIGWS